MTQGLEFEAPSSGSNHPSSGEVETSTEEPSCTEEPSISAASSGNNANVTFGEADCLHVIMRPYGLEEPLQLAAGPASEALPGLQPFMDAEGTDAYGDLAANLFN